MHLIKHHLFLAIRQTKRSKGYALINILGLAVGMACCLLIGLYIHYELAYNQNHKNADRIYRVIRETKTTDQTTFSERTSGGLAVVLKNEYEEVEQAARVHRWNRSVTKGQTKISNLAFCFADKNILNVFDFPLLHGHKETVFQNPNAIIITQNLAHQLFGPENPMGQTVTIRHGAKEYEHLITGIFKDISKQSTLRFDILSQPIPEGPGKKWADWRITENRPPVENYILLEEGHDVKQFESKIQSIIQRHVDAETNHHIQYHLQPINRIHLYSQQDYGISAENHGHEDMSKPHGNIQNIYLLTLLATFILFIACVNFVNLTTAQALNRQKEVGLRKVIGAHKKQLVKQFLSETTCLSFIAFLLAIVCVQITLPTFNTFFDRDINLQTNIIPIGFNGLVLIITVGVLAGSYPAFILSKFQPASILKNTSSTRASTWMRKSLVVGQFSIAILLMVITWSIYHQQHFLRTKNLGFDKEQIVEIPIFGAANGNALINPEQFKKQYNSIKQAFTSHPNILLATASRGPIGQWTTLERFQPEGNNTLFMDLIGVDEDFCNFYGIPLKAGKNFTRQHAETSNGERRSQNLSEQFILNETAAKQLGWANPIGRRLVWQVGGKFFPKGLRQGTVIGLVKDFHFKSLHEKIAPLVLVTESKNMEKLYLKINPQNISETLAFMQTVWDRYIPNRTFTFSFLDENLDRLYRAEVKLSQLFTFVSLLGIFIACLGLFALAARSAQQRTKEIGIRKILGASIPQIFGLIIKEFFTLIMIAHILVFPIAYYAAERWLQNFTYRITLGITPFFLISLVTLLIAFVTVSYQSLKAATANPVDVLRNE